MSDHAIPKSKREQLAQLAGMFGEAEAEAHKDAADRDWTAYYEAYHHMGTS